MKVNWKEVLATLATVIFATLLYGFLFLVLLFFGAFGAFPVYVTKALPWLGITGWLALMAWIFRVSGHFGGRSWRWVKRGLLAMCVLSLGYMAWKAYDAHIPILDDRALLLAEYEPFAGDTKAVSLEEPASLRMTREAAARLRLDGATALYPVYAAFVRAVYPPELDCSLKSSPFYQGGQAQVQCSGTVYAYQALIDGNVDMIFAAGPSKAQMEAAEQAGVELHLTPIGREAFVFFVNSANPVRGLTVEQVRGIYSGAITNWGEVGGWNQRIRPFQRAENSGSQTSLQRLMGDTPLMEPEKWERDVISAMDGIIREVGTSYRNYRSAIGFSFRFYAAEMIADNRIRLLALDGVEPTRENIQNGSYPIASEFYAITASPVGRPAPEETDPDLAAFLEWILSEEGQEIVDRTGYVAVG